MEMSKMSRRRMMEDVFDKRNYRCKKCEKEWVIEKDGLCERCGFEAMFEKFISEKCLIHHKLSYSKDKFFQDYCAFDTQTEVIRRRDLTRFLGLINIGYTTRRYEGIGVNNKRNQNIAKIGTQEVTSREACILLSCEPTQEAMRKLLIKHDLEALMESAIENIKLIEKRIHVLNNDKNLQIKLALALLLTGYFTQTEASMMAECTPTGLRLAITELGIKVDKWHVYKKRRID